MKPTLTPHTPPVHLLRSSVVTEGVAQSSSFQRHVIKEADPKLHALLARDGSFEHNPLAGLETYLEHLAQTEKTQSETIANTKTLGLFDTLKKPLIVLGLGGLLLTGGALGVPAILESAALNFANVVSTITIDWSGTADWNDWLFDYAKYGYGIDDKAVALTHEFHTLSTNDEKIRFVAASFATQEATWRNDGVMQNLGIAITSFDDVNIIAETEIAKMTPEQKESFKQYCELLKIEPLVANAIVAENSASTWDSKAEVLTGFVQLHKFELTPDQAIRLANAAAGYNDTGQSIMNPAKDKIVLTYYKANKAHLSAEDVNRLAKSTSNSGFENETRDWILKDYFGVNATPAP
jgi:hypothetical protein